MDMPLEKYRALVDRLEDYAQRHPLGYRVKLLGLAGLGYLYIFGILAVLLALLGLLGAAAVFGSVALRRARRAARADGRPQDPPGLVATSPRP